MPGLDINASDLRGVIGTRGPYRGDGLAHREGEDTLRPLSATPIVAGRTWTLAPLTFVLSSHLRNHRSGRNRLRNEQGDKAVALRRLDDYQLQMALDYLHAWSVFAKQGLSKK